MTQTYKKVHFKAEFDRFLPTSANSFDLQTEHAHCACSVITTVGFLLFLQNVFFFGWFKEVSNALSQSGLTRWFEKRLYDYISNLSECTGLFSQSWRSHTVLTTCHLSLTASAGYEALAQVTASSM